MKLEWKISQSTKKNSRDEIPIATLYKVVDGKQEDLVLNMYNTKYTYYTIPTHFFKFFKPTFISISSAEAYAKENHSDFKDLSGIDQLKATIEAACALVDKDLDLQIENIKNHLAN